MTHGHTYTSGTANTPLNPAHKAGLSVYEGSGVKSGVCVCAGESAVQVRVMREMSWFCSFCAIET